MRRPAVEGELVGRAQLAVAATAAGEGFDELVILGEHHDARDLRAQYPAEPVNYRRRPRFALRFDISAAIRIYPVELVQEARGMRRSCQRAAWPRTAPPYMLQLGNRRRLVAHHTGDILQHHNPERALGPIVLRNRDSSASSGTCEQTHSRTVSDGLLRHRLDV